jgi:hypothetical protein
VPEYFGLGAIADRMGVTKNTLLKWHRDRAFLMYPRRRGPRTVWYSNDTLIASWEVARCRLAYDDKYRHGRTLLARPKPSSASMASAADVRARAAGDG